MRQPVADAAVAGSIGAARLSDFGWRSLPREMGDKRSDARRGLRRGSEREANLFKERIARRRRIAERPANRGLRTMRGLPLDDAGQKACKGESGRSPFYRAASPVDTRGLFKRVNPKSCGPAGENVG
jgi:hypothetical protein